MSIDLQLLSSTFIMIFLAELGDKTQISTFAVASHGHSPLSVFLGASLALVMTSVVAVLLGSAVGRIVPAKIVKILSGLVFLGFGAVTLVKALRG
jgi:putative Ca2+/H+ antiporter (TMEM165/GDT1 family)